MIELPRSKPGRSDSTVGYVIKPIEARGIDNIMATTKREIEEGHLKTEGIIDYQFRIALEQIADGTSSLQESGGAYTSPVLLTRSQRVSMSIGKVVRTRCPLRTNFMSACSITKHASSAAGSPTRQHNVPVSR